MSKSLSESSMIVLKMKNDIYDVGPSNVLSRVIVSLIVQNVYFIRHNRKMILDKLTKCMHSRFLASCPRKRTMLGDLRNA